MLGPTTPIPKLLRCAQCGEVKKRRYLLGVADCDGLRPVLRLCRTCRQANAKRKETP